MKIGEAEINLGESLFPMEGQSTSGVQQAGKVLGAEVELRDGSLLEVGYTTWANGERDVRVFSRLAGPETYDRLVKGVRMGVLNKTPGVLLSEMRILSFHKEKQPTMVQAQESDFDSVLKGSVRHLLENHGITGFGSRAELIADTSNRKNYLAATYQVENTEAPFVIYVITRILPLLVGFGNTDAVPVGQA